MFSRLPRLARLVAAPAGIMCSRRALCDSAESYREPPAEIVALVDAKPIPSASVQPRQQQMVLYLHHESMLTLEDVSAPVLKLAGARFNPVTLSAHGPNAPNLYHTALELQSLSGERERRARGDPALAARVRRHLPPRPFNTRKTFAPFRLPRFFPEFQISVFWASTSCFLMV